MILQALALLALVAGAGAGPSPAELRHLGGRHAEQSALLHRRLAAQVGLHVSDDRMANFGANKTAVESLPPDSPEIVEAIMHAQIAQRLHALADELEAQAGRKMNASTGRSLLQFRDFARQSSGQNVQQRQRQNTQQRQNNQGRGGQQELPPRDRMAVPLPREPAQGQAGLSAAEMLAKCNQCRQAATAQARLNRAQLDEKCKRECANAPPAEDEERLKRIAAQNRVQSPECPNAASLNPACTDRTNPALFILGVSGTAGALANGLTVGLEVVLDLDTNEVGFFRYGGHYIGSDLAVFNAAGQAYFGLGHKGATRGHSLKAAYSGYFLCAAVGANFFGGVAGTVCVSAVSPTMEFGLRVRPNFAQIKQVLVGLTVSVVPSGPSLSLALPNYVAMSTHKCKHPACVGALLAMAPGDPITKANALLAYTKKYCKDPKHRQGVTCTTLLATKKWINDQVANMRKFGKDIRQLVRDNLLNAEIAKAVNRAGDQVETFLEKARDSPELRPDIYVEVPKRKGAYIKIKSCSVFPPPGGDDPYWKCNGRNSEVGLKRKLNGREAFYWDYNADDSKAGFGMFFQGQSGCVTCELWERQMWPWPEKQTGFKMQKCSGGMARWTSTPVVDGRGKQVATCMLKHQHNK